MLTATADRLPAALAELDPGSRALLDLSLRRGISAAEIGELLRKDPADVERGVEEVLDLLADALEMDGDDRLDSVREGLLDLPDAAWQAKPPPRRPAPPPAVPQIRRQTPDFTPRERRPSGWPVALILLALSAIAIATALIVSGGDDEAAKDDRPASPDARQAPPEPAPPAEGDGERERTVKLQTLAGGPGRGRVTLNAGRDRLVISIRGLPDPGRGAYELWVYSSIVESQSLGSFRDTKIDIDARLPDNLENYRYVDVSREPRDGNPNHSGASVMRAPVDDLLVE